jgi:probable HAF family extracellular repeat protein
MVDLGARSAEASTSAEALNDSGQVVGESGGEPFSWTQAGGMIVLGTVQGPEHCFNCAAEAVNDSGQVVGRAEFPGGEQSYGHHAFSWTQTGGIIDLGTLGGHYESNAAAVNGAGLVVGWAETSVVNPHPFHDHPPFNFYHAFSWTQKGGMVDLGSLGGEASFSSAAALNGSGEVVGSAENAQGERRPVLWNTGHHGH